MSTERKHQQRHERAEPALWLAALSGQNPVTVVIPSNKESTRLRRDWHLLCFGCRLPTTVSYSRIAMHALSRVARFILDRMVPDRRYETLDMRRFVPDASAETLRDVMHELWVNRQVERVGYACWLRHRSASPHQKPVDPQLDARNVALASGSRQTKVVKPDDLFDHDAFTDFFR